LYCHLWKDIFSVVAFCWRLQIPHKHWLSYYFGPKKTVFRIRIDLMLIRILHFLRIQIWIRVSSVNLMVTFLGNFLKWFFSLTIIPVILRNC
jgi:hypothetical protein